jgi:hypothetical protein
MGVQSSGSDSEGLTVGRLASYLQEELERHCPVGWRVQREQDFMRAELSIAEACRKRRYLAASDSS